MATVTADQMKKQTGDTNQFKQAFEQRQAESQGNINKTMDKSFGTQQQGLQTALGQNQAAQTEATQAGQRQFDFAKQDLGVQADRAQRGMDSFADVRGLNRQEGSQQALSLGRARATAAGQLSAAQNRALAEGQRQQELLTTNYNNQVQAAIANRDYKKAAALLDDYNNQNSWLEKNAAQMASFGNFAGYEQLYGNGPAANMRDFWVGSNPELAYNTGAIDAAQYEKITGKKAPDYVPAGGGGGYGNLGELWWYLPEAHVHRGGSSGGGGGPVIDAISGAAPSIG